MRLGLLLLFIAVPLIELALLIKVGEMIGVFATVGLVIITAVIGTWVLQMQGLRTMYRLQESLAKGEPPVEPVVDGMFLLMAGGFLLTPGILTDAVGFLLLVPPVRQSIAKWGFARLIKAGKIRVTTFGSSERRHSPGEPASHPGRPQPDGPADGPVIDGEYERLDDTKPRRGR